MTYKNGRMRIARIKVSRMFKRDPGDLEPLKRSIKARGLLHPLIVTARGDLIAGYRRFLACTQLGWKEVDVRVAVAD